jgi:hypothetical protein
MIPQNQEHRFTVTASDFPNFKGEVIHPVLSTYTLTREFEWAGRLVLLPLLKEGEQGIGTMVEIFHHAPAFENEEVFIKAIPLPWIEGEELIVELKAFVGNRLVASGKTGQRILPLTVIEKIFNKAKESK